MDQDKAEAVMAEIRRVGVDPRVLAPLLKLIEEQLLQAARVEEGETHLLALGAAYYTGLLVFRQNGHEARALDLDRAAAQIGRLSSGDKVR